MIDKNGSLALFSVEYRPKFPIYYSLFDRPQTLTAEAITARLLLRGEIFLFAHTG